MKNEFYEETHRGLNDHVITLTEAVMRLQRIVIKLKEEINELKADKATPKTSSHKEEVTSDEKTEYISVDDAPVWNVYYKVNTSEGIYNTKVQQQAWTEKQAIYLGRTEKLFKQMSEKVKAKEIEAKWSILESVAEKII